MSVENESPDRSGALAPSLKPILAFVFIWLGGSIILLGAILSPLIPGGWLSVGIVTIVALFPAFVLGYALRGAFYPSALVRILVFRPFWYALLLVPPLSGATVVGAAVGLPFGMARTSGYWTAAGFATIIAAAVIVGYAGTRKLVVRNLVVRVPDLPEAFNGLRVVQISDLHVGPQTPRRFLERIVTAVTAARPDLLVVTGDQVDDFPRDVELFSEAFGGLNAPLGVYVIAGNHDIYAGWPAVCAGLARMGWTVLVNEAVPLVRDGHRIWIAGTGDPAGTQSPDGGGQNVAPDIDKTLRNVPRGEKALVLAHNPALWYELARRGVALTLSGHTHYGQLAIPRLGWNMAGLFVKPSMGAHVIADSLLYINPGTNYWGPPLRIGTPPEVTVLVLERGAAGEQASIAGA